MRHIITRAIERRIGIENLRQFDTWLLGDPEVPDGKWFKRFGDFIVCGTGGFVTTFLTGAQSAIGEEVE